MVEKVGVQGKIGGYMTLSLVLFGIAMAFVGVGTAWAGWAFIDEKRFWLGISMLVFAAAFCAIPVIAAKTHELRVEEWGEWRQEDAGNQFTIRDPKVFKYQGRLYRCELIEDDGNKEP